MMSCVPWENETQRAGWYKKEYEYAQKKLQHYKDLEEQGRLIELPCKIGDTVYGRFQCYDGKEIRECKVIGIRVCQFKADSECYYFVDVEFNIIDPFYRDGRLMICRHQAVIGNDYGSWERVFFTKEEAEAALKGAEQ
ncbi:MAG: hypothetical protein MR908_00710 [Firmicutes bacterium]|nr:hypothetical protein [Bacillota bacterium]